MKKIGLFSLVLMIIMSVSFANGMNNISIAVSAGDKVVKVIFAEEVNDLSAMKNQLAVTKLGEATNLIPVEIVEYESVNDKNILLVTVASNLEEAILYEITETSGGSVACFAGQYTEPDPAVLPPIGFNNVIALTSKTIEVTYAVDTPVTTLIANNFIVSNLFDSFERYEVVSIEQGNDLKTIKIFLGDHTMEGSLCQVGYTGFSGTVVFAAMGQDSGLKEAITVGDKRVRLTFWEEKNDLEVLKTEIGIKKKFASDTNLIIVNAEYAWEANKNAVIIETEEPMFTATLYEAKDLVNGSTKVFVGSCPKQGPVVLPPLDFDAAVAHGQENVEVFYKQNIDVSTLDTGRFFITAKSDSQIRYNVLSISQGSSANSVSLTLDTMPENTIYEIGYLGHAETVEFATGIVVPTPNRIDHVVAIGNSELHITFANEVNVNELSIEKFDIHPIYDPSSKVPVVQMNQGYNSHEIIIYLAGNLSPSTLVEISCQGMDGSFVFVTM